MSFLAVYGTLRRFHHNNRLLAEAEYVGTVHIPGMSMYDLGWYPGIVFDEKNKQGIVAEIYHLPEDDKLLAHLDRYEGHPDLFRRVEVTFDDYLEGGGTKTWTTYIYVYNHDTGRAEKIESGDFQIHDPSGGYSG